MSASSNDTSTMLTYLQQSGTSQQKGITYINSSSESIFQSYADLCSRAIQVLGNLQALGIKKGHEVILPLEDNKNFIELFWACILGGIIPVPTAVGGQREHKIKVFKIWDVLNRPWIIASEKEQERLTRFVEEEKIVWERESYSLSTNDVLKPSGVSGIIASPKADDIAYIQFSSGSTGAPKGVIMTHKNIVTNVLDINKASNGSAEDSMLSWVPLTHDMGMVGGHLKNLFLGIDQYQLATSTFIRNPQLWLEKASEHKITMLCSPNFGYKYLLGDLEADKNYGWDLSRVRLIFNGAEPISKILCDEFIEAMTPYGLPATAMFPGYGLAEAALVVTLSGINEPIQYYHVNRNKLNVGDAIEVANTSDKSTVTFVGVGYTLEQVQIKICDDQNSSLDDEKVGHILIKGANVTPGYYNNSSASAELITQDGWLKTGDLGFLKEGRLVITGRAKEIIIINGQNYYPHDIERVAERVADVELGKVVACGYRIPATGKEQLLLFLLHKGKLEKLLPIIDQVKAIIFDAVGLAIDVVVPVRKIPKTTSGKIQRFKLINDYAEGAFKESILNLETAHRNYQNQGFNQKYQLELQTLLSKEIGKLTGHYELNPDQPLMEQGLDSLKGVALFERLSASLGTNLPATLVFDYPSINALAQYLTENLKTEQSQINVKAEPHLPNVKEPIAVIGVACRFPGHANTPEAFWELLEKGIDAVSEVPKERWDVDTYYDADTSASGKMYTRNAALIDAIDQFDNSFFSISPREAESLDPQQRFLLMTAWEAFENAGLTINDLKGSDTGVFMGMSNTDYIQSHIRSGNAQLIDAYSLTGSMFNTAGGRLSYFFDLQGPTIAIDTACSSSLVTIHQAVKSLRAKECTAAIAGGVNTILTPEGSISLSRIQALSPDGRCKTFDESADGYGRGEGCGMVVLKRLSDALKDGDKVLAVIKGSAVNQDGRSNGLTAPNGLAQQKLLRKAIDDAGIGAASVQYIEAHGTGTPLGDPLELQAIGKIYNENRPVDKPLWVGSVKTNIGHLEASAGVAGFIKTVLALNQETIPRNLHFKNPNTFIPWSKLKVQVPTDNVPWKREDQRPRRAGMSSFGFSGTNAHLILEEAPETTFRNTLNRSVHAFTLSATNDKALTEFADRYIKWLENSEEDISDICYTANGHRSHLTQRFATVVSDKSTLVNALKQFKENSQEVLSNTTKIGHAPDVVFLFSGQGSQYAGMCKELYLTSPVFRYWMNQCDALVQKANGGTSILKIIYESDDSTEINNTIHAQPAIFCVSYALYRLWQSYDVKPSVVLGHSIGEFVAATVSGLLKLEDAIPLVVKRGALMQQLPSGGGMLSVMATQAVVKPFLSGISDVDIAAYNSEQQIVLSGDLKTLEQIAEKLKARDIMCVFLRVSHAFHSPLMEPILQEFEETCNAVQFHQPGIPIISNGSGKEADYDEMAKASYWSAHIRQPVKYYQSIEHLYKSGYRWFVEVGSGNILTNLGRQITGADAHWISSLQKGKSDWEQLLHAISQLHIHGQEVNWRQGDKPYSQKQVSLPNYPFQTKRFWMSPLAQVHTLVQAGTDTSLLGEVIDSPMEQQQFRSQWSSDVLEGLTLTNTDTQALLWSRLMEWAQAWLKTQSEKRGRGKLVYHKPLFHKGDQVLEVQTIGLAEAASLFVKSANGSWSRIASWNTTEEKSDSVKFDFNSVITRVQGSTNRLTSNKFYGYLQQSGYQYDTSLQLLSEVWDHEDELLGRLTVSGEASSNILEVLNQVAIYINNEDGTYLREAIIEQMDAWPSQSAQLWVYAQNARSEAVISLIDDTGEILMQLSSFAFKEHAELPSTYHQQYLYQTQWVETDLPTNQMAPKTIWLDAAPNEWVVEQAKNIGALLVAHITFAASDNLIKTIDFEQVYAFQELLGDSSDAELKVIFSHSGSSSDVGKESYETLKWLVSLTKAAAGLSQSLQLVLVTRGVQVGKQEGLNQAAWWGLAKGIASEYPELRCTVIDGEESELSWEQALQASFTSSSFLWLSSGKITTQKLKAVINDPVVEEYTLDPEAVYIITGGLGALGLLSAEQLIAKGARQLLLMGRSKPKALVQQQIDQWYEEGIAVQTVQVDMSDKIALAEVFKTIQVPVKGIIHAAGVLSDGLLAQQSWQDFEQALHPKVLGAWYLHELSSQQPLDFFVLYSSLTALVGLTGQANYAAANSFLDALALYRQQKGLAAISVNWGAWSLGMADRTDAFADQLRMSGVKAINVTIGKQLINNVISRNQQAQVVAVKADWGQYVTVIGADSNTTQLLSTLTSKEIANSKSAIGQLLTKLKNQESDQSQNELLNLVVEKARMVLKMDDSENIDANRPYFDIGFDSLMLNQFRLELNKALGKEMVAVSVFFKHTTLQALALYLFQQVVVQEPITTTTPKPKSKIKRGTVRRKKQAALLDKVTQLSDSEIEKLL